MEARQIGISIIIPCYNAEKYLPQCLDSVLNQSYKEYEIILVNDGSIDATRDICEAYSAKDDRIVVLHKRNQGVSSARNDGIRLARMDYILFLDSDDFMVDGILAEIATILAANSPDIVIGCNMYHYEEASKKISYLKNLMPHEILSRSKEEILTSIIGNVKTMGIWAVWRHVYRRELLVMQGLLFDVKYAYGEDMDFLIQVLLACEHFSCIETPLCYYRIDNEASASNQYKVRSVCNHIEILGKWIRYFEAAPLEEQNQKSICRRLANKMMTILGNISHLPVQEKKIAISYLKQYEDCLKYVHGWKFQGAYVLSKVVGMTLASSILGRI